jgi:hypothetical protein
VCVYLDIWYLWRILTGRGVCTGVPTAMVFIPSIGGISHNEVEDSTR